MVQLLTCIFLGGNIYGFFHLKGPVLNPRAEGFFQLSGLAPTIALTIQKSQ